MLPLDAQWNRAACGCTGDRGDLDGCFGGCGPHAHADAHAAARRWPLRLAPWRRPASSCCRLPSSTLHAGGAPGNRGGRRMGRTRAGARARRRRLDHGLALVAAGLLLGLPPHTKRRGCQRRDGAAGVSATVRGLLWGRAAVVQRVEVPDSSPRTSSSSGPRLLTVGAERPTEPLHQRPHALTDLVAISRRAPSACLGSSTGQSSRTAPAGTSSTAPPVAREVVSRQGCALDVPCGSESRVGKS